MDNIVSFDDIDSERDIAAYQTGLPRIVLEGVDDLRFFKHYWFHQLIGSFEFVEAGDIVTGGGCTSVMQAVEESKKDNIPAFGIWDRDTLFREKKWGSLFETDDAVFHAATSGSDFYTTLRWEVEAYLLEPDFLDAWLRSCQKKMGSSPVNTEAVAIAIEECENLLKAHRYFATAHHCRKPVSNGFSVHLEADAFVSECNSALAELEDDGTLPTLIDEFVATVVRAAPSSAVSRLSWLLKYVDTKRLIMRLGQRFKSFEEIRWLLAEFMRQSNRRPQEIEQKLYQLRDSMAA